MAPTRILDDLTSIGPLGISERMLQTRDVTSKSLTTAALVLAIISTIFFLGMLCVLATIWKQMVAGNLASRSNHLAPEAVGAAVEGKSSDWARKNSNVLWSMYIEDDDLKSQFSLPPKSRLFSIGSISSEHGICPLDRCAINAGDLSKSNNPSDQETKIAEPVDRDAPRNRVTYQQETTPTKNVPRARAMSQPFHHRQSDSLEHVARRKQSISGEIPRRVAEIS